MLAITQVNYIRKLYFDKGKSFTEIEKATGHNYRTIKKYVEQEDFNEPLVKKSSQIKSDLIKPFVRNILLEDKNLKKKHRHTAKAIYKRVLREEPELCQVAERTMRTIVKQERLKLYEDAPCFLDLNHPGGEAQVDFGEIYVIKNSVRKLMHELVLSFPASNVGYCQVTRSETMEALMESLVAIFEYTGLVPNKIWFDQMASACIRKKDDDGNPQPTDRFLRFSTHYGFDIIFCNDYAGHEKGNVEKKVGYFRNNLFIPAIDVTDLGKTNLELFKRCDEENDTNHYKHSINQLKIFEQEKAHMRPLNPTDFDTARYEKRRVDKYGHIKFGGCKYSVSPQSVSDYVWVKIMANDLIILSSDHSYITQHKRSFEEGHTFTHWLDFMGLILNRPRALKYSGFYESLPDDWRHYLSNLEQEPLKKALKFFQHCLIWDNILFSQQVLDQVLRSDVRDPEALWTTYYRLKEDHKLYRLKSTEDQLINLPVFESNLAHYDALIGGVR